AAGAACGSSPDQRRTSALNQANLLQANSRAASSFSAPAPAGNGASHSSTPATSSTVVHRDEPRASRRAHHHSPAHSTSKGSISANRLRGFNGAPSASVV